MSIYTHPHGEQYLKIYAENDSNLVGEYQVRIFATDQECGLTNHETTFRLKIEKSALTRLCSPMRAFKGSPVNVESNDRPVVIPLPKYNDSADNIKYAI